MRDFRLTCAEMAEEGEVATRFEMDGRNDGESSTLMVTEARSLHQSMYGV